MGLRNLNTGNSCFNGTKLQVCSTHDRFLEVGILAGVSQKQQYFIPSMNPIYSETRIPFRLQHYQFPIRLSFCITINKVQSQTIYQKVSIDLPKPVFVHGQLYVVFSRKRVFDDVQIFVNNSETKGYHTGSIYTLQVVELMFYPPPNKWLCLISSWG